MTIPKNKFSCTVNTEDGGTHLWVDNEDNEPSIHMLLPWEGRFRKEGVVCLDKEQLAEFKKQVAAL